MEKILYKIVVQWGREVTHGGRGNLVVEKYERILKIRKNPFGIYANQGKRNNEKGTKRKFFHVIKR